MQKSISKKEWSGPGAGCLFVFFSIFFLVGAAVLWFVFLKPVLRIASAKKWTPTRCQIVSSEVVTHPGDDGATYSIKIVYSYRTGGAQYTSDRYDFNTGSSSGYDWRAKVVSQHPAGSKTICYVNPKNPREAVFDREFHSRQLFILLFSIPFMLAGAGGMIATPWFNRQMSQSKQPKWKPQTAAATFAPALPARIKPKQTPVKKFIWMLAICLFWNGIVSVFVFVAARAWRGGNPEWFLNIFLIPFVLVGLALIWGVFYQLLALFNPRSVVTMSTQQVVLGESVDLQWEIRGRSHLIQRLQIYLEGQEEATYRRGTDTYTDKNTFATISMLDTTSSMNIRAGTVRVRIPENTIHSFESPNNKIIWTIHMKGGIKNWPDLLDEFMLIVTPFRLSSISRRRV